MKIENNQVDQDQQAVTEHEKRLVELGFERAEVDDVEQEEKRKENHGQYLHQRRHQEHVDYEHETVEHEDWVEEPTR